MNDFKELNIDMNDLKNEFLITNFKHRKKILNGVKAFFENKQDSDRDNELKLRHSGGSNNNTNNDINQTDGEVNKKLNDKNEQPKNVFNEEKKNDNNKMDTFWGIHGNKININGKMITYNSGSTGSNTIYSSLPLSQGIHSLKLKLLEMSSHCSIEIGITSTTNYKNDSCFGKNKDTSNYGYQSDGYKYSHEYDEGVYTGSTGYGSNDIIGM
eukprot:494295_1